MAGLRAFLSRARSLFRRRRLEAALDEELRAHLEMLADDYVRAGMTRDEARRRARLRLGGIEQTKEAVRDARATWIDSVWQDARYALRIFGRDRAFTAVAILTLALGIGGTTGIFSVVNAAIFRPLPYPDSRRLMAIDVVESKDPGGVASHATPAQFLEWRDRSKSFETLAGAWHTSMIVSGIGQPRQITVVEATADFFRLLGVRPVVGRVFNRRAQVGVAAELAPP